MRDMILNEENDRNERKNESMHRCQDRVFFNHDLRQAAKYKLLPQSTNIL